MLLPRLLGVNVKKSDVKIGEFRKEGYTRASKNRV